ncbi:MAG: phosphoadenosine phosphosulfate reductase [Betaproteobacteria bacterium RIFCSPLOWO2_02_FULL_64_12]|nr:MAG: phosphoadenosine phosphosulfate reductase [Betaproteobacteria bacterium RIFCSPLOWO2_02_FULL_64_12]
MSARLQSRIEELARTLGRVALEHPPAALASSLSAEDMVITDAILTRGLEIEIFTLDTGRLHADTLKLIDAIRHRYGYPLRVHKPEPAAVEQYVIRFGRDAFYDDTALRKRCCEIRKVDPLRRALAGKSAWITGMRRAQSVTRGELALQQADPVHGIVKFNPLAQWSESEVWEYLHERDVPYNALYDQGYRSIGCAPCTRPTTPDEDVRAGRWWWEDAQTRECGLHLGPDGRLARVKEHAA